MTHNTPGIASRAFGKVGGTKVDLYTLTNEQGMQVQVSTLGATLVGVFVQDKHGEFDNVVLSMASAEDYLADTAFLGRTVGPVANRIAQAQFEVDGVSYPLDKNDGEHCLHSGPSGFHNKIWNASGTLTAEGCELRLVVKHGHLEGGFPGNKQVEVRYLLGHDNTLRILFHAESDLKTPISLTNHAYFNLAAGGDVLSHHLQLRSGAITPVTDTLITTKDFMPVVNTPFDFEPAKTIGKALVSDHTQMQIGSGYDHNYVLNSEGGPFAVLADRQSGRRMTVSTDMPGVQLYSANFVQGTQNAAGEHPFQQYAGVCLEAQNYPDTPNWPDRPDFWVSPERPYQAFIQYDFDVLS
ncbi:MAG TPA: galactose-1-epimerase [Alteromonas sp.]|nr:galactose-1-epimerase [Alteromonadaceae bacterium]MAX43275.1 galactose-1-epimerase [Alteromonadaceae bacterium]HBY39472.1 galactose-1-epimerase [Alteromonas sp.]|tara:strand:- start:17036 stop:18094 length:1059 start_codon:yes stop_codon:yes gene_type:complete